jgi:membrane-associated phospholipid phosphatase
MSTRSYALASDRLIPARATRALIAAATLLGVFAVEWYLVFHVARASAIDGDIYHGFRSLRYHAFVNHLATFTASLCNPSPYVYFAAVVVAVAIIRRRFLLAATIVLILAGANETTHLLKPLLAASRPSTVVFEPLPGSFPSGHSTAAMALALCAVIASPPRLRRYVAIVGAVFALGVMYSVVTLGWHYPSDAFGGLLVASIWTLAGLAGLFTAEAHHGRRSRPVTGNAVGLVRELEPAALAVLGTAALISGALLIAPNRVVTYAAGHTAFVVGAAGLGAFAVVVATAVMVSLRR